MESLVHDSEEAFGIGDVECSVEFKRIFQKLCLCHVISGCFNFFSTNLEM